MKIGNKVRIVKIPDGLVDDEEFQTKSLFELCLGRTFPISGIDPVVETGGLLVLLELHVGRVLGKLAVAHSIWIESECVEFVRKSN